MWTVSLAEAFIHVFQVAGKIFLDMMTGLIPMLICLLLAINFLMKLVGTVRMEKVAALLGRSRILTYGVLPVLGWFFMSSPGALTLGKLLPEKSKPGYEASRRQCSLFSTCQWFRIAVANFSAVKSAELI